MAIKKVKYTTHSIALILIICGILVVVNYLSLSFFARADLTEQKEYTISQATKTRLKNLDDLVNVKVYFSKNLPPYLLHLQQKVQDMLDEYKAYAGGKMKMEYIDPARDQKTEEQVRSLGIPQLQLNIIEKDKTQLRNAYLGIGIFFEDRKEVIPVVQHVGNLEYDLTSAIIKVSNKDVKTIGFLAGHQEKDINEDYETIRQTLEKTYHVRKVEIKGESGIPKEISTLVVPGPKEISDRDKYEIDQYLMRGGKLILLLDPVQRQEKSPMANPIKTNLEDLLGFWGVKLSQDLVLDRQNVNATFSTGFIRFSQPYPYWVKVTKNQFSKENPAVGKIESMVLPWTGYLEITTGAKDKGLKVTEMAKSSDNSWTQKGNFNLNPQQQFKPNPDSVKSYTLAVALEGKFKSFFAGKEIPPAKTEGDDKEKAEKGDKPAQPKATINESPDTQVLILANSNFIAKDFIQQFRENANFFLNLTDWLNLGSDLMGIRSRAVIDRPLREIGDQSKSYVKFLCIWAVPILIVLFGLVRFYLKRRQRRLYEEIYVS